MTDFRELPKGKLAMLCYPPRSGITHYTFNLCRELAAYFPDMYVILNRSADLAGQSAAYREVRLFSRTRWLGIDLVRLFVFVFGRRIKYLHFQSALKNWIVDLPVLLVFRIFGRKIIFTAHDVLPHTRKAWEKIVIRRIYHLFDLIIVHSEHSRGLLAAMNIKSEKIRTIPHGLYTMFLPARKISMAEARQTLGIDPENKVLLFFGSINPRKGAEKIVRGFEKLIRQQKNITLVMAGNVDYPEGYLENLARERNLERSVQLFRGWVPNERVHYFFTSADMVILPYNEGFTSGVLKLAYAFGKPVIASGVGELADVIRTEKTGVILDEFFSEETARQVAGILNSKQQLEDFRKNIESVAEEKYSWKSIAQKTAAAYSESFPELV